MKGGYVMMGLPGIEPGTSRLSGVRSNRLSYKPGVLLIIHVKRGFVKLNVICVICGFTVRCFSWLA